MIPVLAVATKRKKQVEILERSFKMHEGWDLRVLGVGRKWESFRTKMECYCEELRRINQTQVVVCLDAYDVVCVRDSNGFVEEFKKFNVPIVAGYESFALPTIYNKYVRFGMSPCITPWKAHHNVSAKDVYVNSGCIVGYAGEVLQMWEWILGYEEFTISDDQVGVGFYMNKFPAKVKLDTESWIVLNDHVVYKTKIERRGDKLSVSGPDHAPYFMHFQGMRDTWGWRANRYRKVSAFVLEDDSLAGEEIPMPTNWWWWCSMIMVGLTLVVAMLAKMILRREKDGEKQRRR